MTWFEVQQKLVAAQAEHMMCIHKQELTPLDVYHRILRYTNYMVAMVNKSLLPLRFTVPFLGDHAFLSTGLRFNLELLLFKSPWVSHSLTLPCLANIDKYINSSIDFSIMKCFHVTRDLSEHCFFLPRLLSTSGISERITNESTEGRSWLSL